MEELTRLFSEWFWRILIALSGAYLATKDIEGKERGYYVFLLVASAAVGGSLGMLAAAVAVAHGWVPQTAESIAELAFTGLGAALGLRIINRGAQIIDTAKLPETK